MPSSWSKVKRRERYGSIHQQTPDLDNLLKGFQDALCADDKHIADLRLAKYWSILGAVVYYPRLVFDFDVKSFETEYLSVSTTN